jgi:Protein of unknown function (DUF3800)
MVMQAFIDESYSQKGVYVLAGYIATAEAWANFSKEWKGVLHNGTRDKYGRDHFKMKEMAVSERRRKRLPIFFRVIEKHVALAVSCKVNVIDIQRAKNRLWIPNVSVSYVGALANPWMFEFVALLDMLFHNRNRELIRGLIPEGERVDFYFDETSQKRAVTRGWEAFVSRRPDAFRQFCGAPPRFKNDNDFPQLQAADFWAWWIRRWHEDGTPEKSAICDFGVCRAAQDTYRKLEISASEDQIVDIIKQDLRKNVTADDVIYDVRFFWNGKRV